MNDRGGRRVTAVGSALIDLGDDGGLTPFLIVGAGAARHMGDSPSATLSGAYGMVFPPPTVVLPPGVGSTVVVNDKDTVTIQTEAGTRAVFAVGGGFKYATRGRTGIRVDVRDYVGGNPQRVTVTAAPESSASPAAFIIGTTPRLVLGGSQFLRSTLSGPRITAFETYRGTGVDHDVHLSAGVFWRF